MKSWNQCESEKSHPSMMTSNILRHLLDWKVLPTSRGLQLYITPIHDIDDQLLHSDVHTEVGHIYVAMII